MDFDGKHDEFEKLLREYVRSILKEFMTAGAGSIAGYTLPLGAEIDPESFSNSKISKKKKKKIRNQ